MRKKITAKKPVDTRIIREKFANPPVSDTDFFDVLCAYNLKNNKDLIAESDLGTDPGGVTGVMNPFVLARIIDAGPSPGSPHFIAHPFKKPDDMIDALNTCEGSEIKTYADIFDPDKSPIFAPVSLPSKITSYASVEAPLTGMTKANPNALHHIMPVNGDAQPLAMKTEMAMKKPLALEFSRGVANMRMMAVATDSDSSKGKVGAENTNPDYKSEDATEYKSADTNLCQIGDRNKTAYISDVIQGAAVDCYFLAALYSAAWAYPGSFPPVLNANTSGYYSISFYTYPGNLSKITTTVRSTYPVDRYGHLVFTQKTPQSELWTALYEKAYARFKGLAKSTLTNALADDPEISTFTAWYPLNALTNITRLLSTEKTTSTGIPPTQYDCSGFTAGKSYSILTSTTNLVNNVTSYPTVAWTYDKGAIPSGSTGYFKNAAIVSSHAYSLLGIFLNTAGLPFIVLRNPWGNKINPASDATLANLRPYLATNNDTWTPSNGPSITFGNNADGIFALQYDKFEACFAGFGWVRFTKIP